MIGQTVSHYKILTELGSGGMGVVYKAEDLKLKRTVALKFLPPELTRDAAAKSRFIREAQAASALQHNNICTIHEIDETDDQRLFICMDCYEGETLTDKVAKGPLALDEALRITIHAAEGLAKAHDEGMVHRDIKTANLMVTTDGVVKILDFGLAKLAGGTKVTKTGTTVGTVAYMSPEQARGEDVDKRSDVWSLGVVLYELISGALPFKGDQEVAMLYGITHSDPEPLTALRPDIPEELDWIADKALSKNPNQRYQSSNEFVDDLQAVFKSIQEESVAGLAVKARPRKRRGRSRRLWPSLLAGVVLAAVVLAIVLKFSRGPADDLRTFAPMEGTPLVAITPFENKTGDPSLDNVASLTSEILAQDLAGLDLVETMYAGGAMNASGSNNETGNTSVSNADIVVSGAIHLDGESLGFITRVSEVKTGRLISALPIIQSLRDKPRDGINEVSQRVTGAIAMRLYNPFRQPLPSHPPTYEAFLEYQLALDTFDDEWGSRTVFAAIERMRRATELDSTFLRPLVLVPQLYWFVNRSALGDTALMEIDGFRSRLDEYERLFVDMDKLSAEGNRQAALGVAERLELLAPEDQIVQMVKLGFLMDLNRPQAALETYSAINASEDQEHRLVFAIQTRRAADQYHALGRYEEELKLRKRLIEYYPNMVLFRMDEAWAYTGTGNMEAIRRVITECQSIPGLRGYLDWNVSVTGGKLRAHGHREAAIALINDYIEERLAGEGDPISKPNLASMLYVAERWEEARTINEELIVLNPARERRYQESLGLIAARLGDRETAMKILAEYVEDGPDRSGRQFVNRAKFAAVLGDHERAVALLREAGVRGHAFNHWLFFRMDLESLRGYPPFDELARVKD